MISAMHLRNFAIAASVDLEFGPGLTVITGETGAGKSILVDALGLLLGGRGHERVVRAGAEQAELEARFDAVRDADTLAALAERGIELDDGSLVVRRSIGRNGTRRAWINGRMATGADLRAIVGPLVDLSTQHQQNRLLDRKAHLGILDRAAGLGDALAAYRDVWGRWRACRDEVHDLRTRIQKAAERSDYLRFCAAELDEAGLEPGETARLDAEVRKLRAGESLLRVASTALAALSDDGGARDILAGLPRELERSRRDDETLADFAGRVHDIIGLIDELASDLERYADSVGRDPARLAKAEERLDRLLALARKYGGNEAAMLERQVAIAEELRAGDIGEDRLHALERSLPALERAAIEAAAALTQARSAAAATLSAEVEAVIGALGMEKARFRVAIETVEGGLPGPDGLDKVQFLLQSNPGEPAQGLVEVASGGELSRVLLGLERAASRTGGAPSAVYDEVDAGLSGSTGIALGRFLAELGRHQQLLVISHLPQVAAAADQHLHVHKVEKDGRTESGVAHLDDAGRLRELARMLGAGDAATGTALQHAGALLHEAQIAVDRRPQRVAQPGSST